MVGEEKSSVYDRQWKEKGYLESITRMWRYYFTSLVKGTYKQESGRDFEYDVIADINLEFGPTLVED